MSTEGLPEIPIVSRQYRPDQRDGCCEACVFGRGPHTRWCWARKFEQRAKYVERDPLGLENGIPRPEVQALINAYRSQAADLLAPPDDEAYRTVVDSMISLLP